MTDEAVATETLALLEEWAEREPDWCVQSYIANSFFWIFNGDKKAVSVDVEHLGFVGKAIISAAVQERFEEAGVYIRIYQEARYGHQYIKIRGLPLQDWAPRHLAWLRAWVAWLKSNKKD